MTVFAYLPGMSETMEEATIIEWHVMEGETVERGQLLYTIETEKANFEITAPDSGTVLKIVATENCTVQVGAVVAVIGDPDEVFDLPMQSTRHPSVATLAKDPVTSLDILNHRIKASPVAKSLASKLGINLSEIDGTGSGGIVTKKDVEKYNQLVSQKPSHRSERYHDTIIPLVGRRRTIAERMAISHRTIPAVTTVTEVDCSKIRGIREGGGQYSYTTFVVCATACSIPNNASLNAVLDNDNIILKRGVNISVAIDTDQGLITPVIHNTDRLTLDEIQQKLEELTGKAKNNTLSTEELEGGTFTISNSGVLGALFFTPIINYPQSAILGMGKAIKKPVVIDDEIAIREMMLLCLSYDHRIIDGAQAVRFLQDVRGLLENPTKLLERR